MLRYIKFNYIYIFLFILIIYLIFCISNKETFTNGDKKVVLITGATSGIGKSLIKLFKSSKYKVVIHGRDCNKLKNIINNYNVKIDIETVCLDLSKKKNIYVLIQEMIVRHKKVDILINNFYDSSNPNDIEYQISTNLTNTLLLTNKLCEIMSDEGKIINISSGLSDSIETNGDFIDMYSIIKSSIEKFTKIMATKLYNGNVGITCLKINDSYKSKLTDTILNKKILLKNPRELHTCFKYLLDINWKEITGKIITSSSIIDGSVSKLFDSGYSYNEDTIYSTINESQTKNKILGENLIKMSDNINPLIRSKNWNFAKYATNKGKLKKILAKKYNVDTENICFHNGTVNFLDKMIKLLVDKNHEIITPENSWGTIDVLVGNQNKNIIRTHYKIKNNFVEPNFDSIFESINSNTRLIYLISPINKKEFDMFLSKIPKNLPIIIDFCYNEFYPEKLNPSITDETIINMGDYLSKNIISVNTFSKFYSIPGLNLSYSVTNEKISQMIEQNFHYPISNLTEEIAITALEDKNRNNETISYYNNERNRISKLLKSKKIKFFFTYQNTTYIKTKLKLEEIKSIFKKNNINLEITLDGDFIQIPILNKVFNDKIISLIN